MIWSRTKTTVLDFRRKWVDHAPSVEHPGKVIWFSYPHLISSMQCSNVAPYDQIAIGPGTIKNSGLFIQQESDIVEKGQQV